MKTDQQQRRELARDLRECCSIMEGSDYEMPAELADQLDELLVGRCVEYRRGDLRVRFKITCPPDTEGFFEELCLTLEGEVPPYDHYLLLGLETGASVKLCIPYEAACKLMEKGRATIGDEITFIINDFQDDDAARS